MFDILYQSQRDKFTSKEKSFLFCFLLTHSRETEKIGPFERRFGDKVFRRVGTRVQVQIKIEFL